MFTKVGGTFLIHSVVGFFLLNCRGDTTAYPTPDIPQAPFSTMGVNFLIVVVHRSTDPLVFQETRRDIHTKLLNIIRDGIGYVVANFCSTEFVMHVIVQERKDFQMLCELHNLVIQVSSLLVFLFYRPALLNLRGL